ncbi:MAG: protein kinase [Actinomycetota bacterium]|nr:protein kinase [Actinomycetota bacterium]
MKVGEVVAGRYELEALLGAGGMSSVFRARDRVLERTVALKILHEQHSRDREYVERFRREARAIARLSHPNIVTVIDRGEFEGRQYIVFEYVSGETLKERVEREGRLPVAHALALAHQIARGLAFAHENGVVHRDVKPHNVLVDEDGTAKVTDFGVARWEEGADTLTEAGTVLGTGDYLAPEQALGQEATERSDQYSLGVVLYELLAGEVPYAGESVVAVAAKHVHQPVPSILAARPGVSPRIDALIRRAMAKPPEDRFPSLDAMIAALEATLAEEAGRRWGENGATRALPVVAAHERRTRPRRSRLRLGALLAALVAFAALAALLALGALPGLGRDGDAARRQAQAPIRLVAVSDYDPEGGDGEHSELVGEATDGDRATFWRTETYQDFDKAGVGIVLDARRPRKLDRLVVFTDTPGFTADVRAGDSRSGPFARVSDERKTQARTVLRVSGGEHRYYLLWITDLDHVAHVNEVRAR